MKNLLIRAAALAAAILVVISVGAQTNEDLKAKIEKINKDMQQAMLAGNTSAVLAHYSEDAISMPNYGKMAKGIEAIKASNDQMMSSGMKITGFETHVDMLTTCENNIAEIGTYTMRFTIEGMGGEMSDTGKYLTIWNQEADGSLKIALEMWNTDNYPMGQ